jgi:hypothetical protein
MHHPEMAATTTPQPSEALASVIYSFSSWIPRLGRDSNPNLNTHFSNSPDPAPSNTS